MNGLYGDDFIGYKVPTDEEIENAIRTAIVSIDANVLLNLYRYRSQTSQDLLNVLEHLDERLVVPHQALREFWRHRSRAPASPEAATKVVTDAINKIGTSLNPAFSTWAKQVGVEDDEVAKLGNAVESAQKSLRDLVGEILSFKQAPSDTEDHILAALERLLADRVSIALSDEELQSCIAEAQRRVDSEEPPGYCDAAKEDGDTPEGAAGDYLVWFQSTRYAAEKNSDLLLVTGDEKEDWWWRQRSTFVGPRPELAHEFHQLCGQRLFMLRPTDLLARAGALEVQVDSDSAADAERRSESIAPSAPWTASGVGALLERLQFEAPVQAAALRQAIANGGRVLRADIFALGAYSDDRMLRGFTRPFLRITKSLIDEGVISAGVDPIFVARYPDGVKASYFTIPPEVADMFSAFPPVLTEEQFLNSGDGVRRLEAKP